MTCLHRCHFCGEWMDFHESLEHLCDGMREGLARAIWTSGPTSEAARAYRGEGSPLTMRVTAKEADIVRVCLEQPELDYAREKWGLDALALRFQRHFVRHQ